MLTVPLDRVKFCSTGVPSDVREDVASKIKKMGGIHELHLLSDVKYLIVGSKDTDKYRFCLKNRYDIRFIEVYHVLDMYQKWLKHEKIDLNCYRLKIFKDMKICLSRLVLDDLISKYFGVSDDLETLKSTIMDLVSSNGGDISTSLSFSTHAMVTNDLQGKKYDMAKVWKIPVIHPIWVILSVRRAAVLEYKHYDIQRLDAAHIDNFSDEIVEGLSRKRTREPENDENEAEQKKDLIIKRKNPKVWDSIMSTSVIVSKNTKKSEWDDEADSHEDGSRPNNNPFNSISIPKVSTSSILNPHSAPLKKVSDLFKDKKFLVKFFHLKEQNILKKVIESHSGTILEEGSSDLDYLIIPSDFEVSKVPAHFRNYETLTEWFIERSLHYSTLQIDQWGRPFYRPLSKSSQSLKSLPPKGLNIGITGFQGIELLHITKMIEKLMIVPDDLTNAFTLSETLSKDVDLLIVNIDLIKLSSSNNYLTTKNPTLFKQDYNEKDISMSSFKSTKSKMKFAKANQIPIVTISFLFEFFLGVPDDLININFKYWCLYCPRLVNINPRIKSLIVDSTTQTEGQQISQIPKAQLEESPDAHEDSLPKLPSPIRNKRQNKNLRLIGRSKVSYFDSNSNSYNHKENFDLDEPQEDELRTTQISYANIDDDQNLLGNSKSDDTGAVSNGFKRRTTRGAYKELMDLGNDDS
jgi:DNA replication regulator DPB11